MTNLNTLFLPLLGGFLFYGLFNGTSHRARVEPGQVLLFWSAAIGLALLLAARAGIHLFMEGFVQPERAQLGLLLAVDCPLVAALVLGFAIWFLTHAVQGTIVDSHKLKAVLGIISAVLAATFLLELYPLLAEAPQVFGFDVRMYTLAGTALLAWASQSFARFGAIPWGAAMIRISAAALLVATLLHFIVEYQASVVAGWHSLTAPIVKSEAAVGLGSAFVACLLGVGSAWLANFVYTKDVAETRYALGKGPSQLERLFWAAASANRLVVLTMDDRKVYVGTVKRVAIRGNTDPYVVIYPAISGYRVDGTLTVVFTTFYQDVYRQLPANAWGEFQKILPMQRIASAGYYEQRHHDMFYGPKLAI